MAAVWINVVYATAVICLNIYGTAAILCYQCAETADGHCTYGIRGLMAQRKLHEIDREPLANLNRLKNCSHYLDSRGEYQYQYCKIERIHAHGTTNAYIRDCADGFTFGINVTRLQQIRGDNQTICGYSQLHVATVCVSICDSDFCNGPLATAGNLHASAVVAFAIIMIGTLVQRLV